MQGYFAGVFEGKFTTLGDMHDENIAGLATKSPINVNNVDIGLLMGAPQHAAAFKAVNPFKTYGEDLLVTTVFIALNLKVQKC